MLELDNAQRLLLLPMVRERLTGEAEASCCGPPRAGGAALLGGRGVGGAGRQHLKRGRCRPSSVA
eukprot:8051794-Alexandrium_andersonii.AAC.1